MPMNNIYLTSREQQASRIKNKAFSFYHILRCKSSIYYYGTVDITIISIKS